MKRPFVNDVRQKDLFVTPGNKILGCGSSLKADFLSSILTVKDVKTYEAVLKLHTADLVMINKYVFFIASFSIH